MRILPVRVLHQYRPKDNLQARARRPPALRTQLLEQSLVVSCEKQARVRIIVGLPRLA